MDPLAHTLLGAALAKTRLGRSTPLAMPTLVLASNVPDVDVAAYFWGSDAALGFRRGLTHGPLGLALLPALVALVVWSAGARARTRPGASQRRLYALAYLGALTHPALDWLNTYGVRFLHPWSERWFYGDTLFIVDPWMWLLLGAAVFLAHRADRWSIAGWAGVAAIATSLLLAGADSTPGKLLWLAGLAAVLGVRAAGRPRTESGRRRAANACVVAFAVYLAASIAIAAAARSTVAASIAAADRQRRAFEERLAVTPRSDLMVGPLPVTLLRREVVAGSATEIRYGRFRWLERPHLTWSDWTRPRPLATPVLDAALRDPSVRGFLAWVRFLYVEIDEHPDHYEVHLMDARYTLERNARFGSAVVRVPRYSRAH